jgi:hypothetical protein
MLMYQHPTAKRLPIGDIESITPPAGELGYLLARFYLDAGDPVAANSYY